MASIDRKGPAPILILDETEYTILTAVCLGTIPPDHRRTRSLRKAGILNTAGPTPECAPIVEGLTTARRRFLGSLMHPAEGRHIETWIGAQSVTGVLIEGNTHRLQEVAPCDNPSLVLPLLDLRPREMVDLGPHTLPGKFVELIDRGNLDAADRLLRQVSKNIDHGGEPGAHDGPSPLTVSFAHGTWTVSALACFDLDGEQWRMSDLILTLSVPECLYELAYDDTQDEAITRLAPVSSLAVWTRISSWFFPRG